jgi:hypothetical protein
MAKTLEAALAHLGASAGALNELSWVWPVQDKSLLWWDTERKVLSTQHRRAGYRALYGSFPLLRSFAKRGAMRTRARRAGKLLSPYRWQGPNSIEAALPRDAIIVPPVHDVTKLVIVSSASELVLKLTYDQSEIKNEVANWHLVQKAGIEKHVPRVLGHGETTDGACWLLSQLVPNTNPLGRPLNPLVDPRTRWAEWLGRRIFPVLERFFEASGLDMVDAGGVLNELQGTFRRPDMPLQLVRLVDLADKIGANVAHRSMIFTTTHQDLSIGHTHRSGADWWIIDWGSSGRNLTSAAFFRRYIWSPIGEDVNAIGFWAWLGGLTPVPSLPNHLRFELELYLDWYSKWRKTEMDAESLRFQLLLSFIQDVHGICRSYDLRETLMNADDQGALPPHVRALPSKLKAMGVG